MKKLSISQMEKIEGGIFWGRDFTSCTAITNGAGGVLYYWRCYDYYMFWIRVETGVCGEAGSCGNYNYE
jgi:hypothetical protein